MSDDKRIQFRITRNPDGSPLRDKDNAKPIYKPSHARNPPTFAPGGSVGMRPSASTQEKAKSPLPPVQQDGIATKYPTVIEHGYVTDGLVLSMPGYRFAATVMDDPSRQGLGGGRIEELTVTKGAKPVAIYDRGWIKDPETAEAREAIHRIRKGLDDTPRREFEGIAKSSDKGQSMDR